MTTRILIAAAILTGFVAYAVVGQERNWIEVEHSYGSPQRPSVADRIEQALGARGKWDYSETTLEDVMRHVSTQFGINIWIDKETLSADGINTDQQVTLVLPDASLSAGLDLILGPLSLTFVIEDEVLKITTQIKADESMPTRVYPVRDLLEVDESGFDNYQFLMSAIEDLPASRWEQIDGEGGTISPVPNAGSLVISNTQHVHRRIEGLLTALRKAKRLQHIPSVATDPDDVAVLRPESVVDRPSLLRRPTPRATPSWQQPRVYSE